MADQDSGPRNTLTVTDNRTGRQYEIDVHDGDVIRAMDLRQIKVEDGDFGMMSYDPAFTNTASTTSRVTFINGGEGILEYRGYPIEVLAKHCDFTEVSYLLIYGELPTEAQLAEFREAIRDHTMLHEDFKRFFGALPRSCIKDSAM